MFNRKFIAIALSMLCLTACSANNDVQQTSVSETTMTVTTSAETTTASVVTEAVTTTEITTEKPMETISICGTEFKKNTTYIEIDGTLFTEKDADMLGEMNNLTHVSVDKANTYVLEKLAEHDNIKSVCFKYFDGTLSEYTELLEPFNEITINGKNYLQSEAEMLCRTFPNKEITYQKYIGCWDNYETSSLYITGSPVIMPFDDELPSKIWWGDAKNIALFFVNSSEAVQTAESVKILFNDSNGWTPISFAEGTSELVLNADVDAGETFEFEITGDILDYNTLNVGLYKAVTDFSDGTSAEFEFFVGKDYLPYFLSEEQLDVFMKTYEMSIKYMPNSRFSPEQKMSDETYSILSECFSDDFISRNSYRIYLNDDGSLNDVSDAGRGTPVANGHCFIPLNISDERADFMVTCVLYHPDMPALTMFETNNFSLIKTDEGWKINNFTLGTFFL